MSLASLYNRPKGAAHIAHSNTNHVDRKLRMKLIWLLERGAITQGEAALFADVTYGTVRAWLAYRNIDCKKARRDYIKRMLELAQEYNDDQCGSGR